ncbi:MAG: type II toxin-antitoxin system RelE/ParE family toxin [Betaproteobacteria bacterium]|nr:type II toxin-antitoxin system RelE/ParE family toxin [Betaproteobacteria bacterium]
MYTVRMLPEFVEWLSSIKDGMTHRRLARRLKKASNGNFGDVEPVGSGVSELREHFGTGWRMYFVQRGQTIIVMLGGGTKATQKDDIKRARAIAETLED